MGTRFDLIIFDCDGVLVDSERVSNEVFAGVLEEVCGLRFTLEDMFDTFVGHSRDQCLQKIETLIGEPPPPELDQRYQQDINRVLAESVAAIDGIETVLEKLALPYCVASSGSHEKMKMTLGKTDLMRFFLAKFSVPAMSNVANRIPIFTCMRPGPWESMIPSAASSSKTAPSE